jgi:hypothetical protein
LPHLSRKTPPRNRKSGRSRPQRGNGEGRDVGDDADGTGGGQKEKLNGIYMAILKNSISAGYNDLEKEELYRALPSHAMPLEHECSHQVSPCGDSSCEFFSQGFGSKSELLKHNRSHHPESADSKMPLNGPLNLYPLMMSYQSMMRYQSSLTHLSFPVNLQ